MNIRGKMIVRLPGKKRVDRDLLDIWLRVATDIRAGMSIPEIQKRYPNELTGKPRSRAWVYYVLNRLSQLNLIEIVKD